jgi:hypothetical protein
MSSEGIEPPIDSLVAYVAGVLATFPPFRDDHPERCIPMARAVLDALGEWTPDE